MKFYGHSDEEVSYKDTVASLLHNLHISLGCHRQYIRVPFTPSLTVGKTLLVEKFHLSDLIFKEATSAEATTIWSARLHESPAGWCDSVYCPTAATVELQGSDGRVFKFDTVANRLGATQQTIVNMSLTQNILNTVDIVFEAHHDCPL